MTIRSRLPSQHARLRDLANRIDADGHVVLERHGSRWGWGELVTRWAPVIGLAAAAGFVLLVWMPPPPTITPNGSPAELSIAPGDSFGARLAFATEPPDASTLLTLRVP